MSDTTSPQSLFDEYGRCLPTNVTAEVHQKIRRWFVCVQPEIDYAAIHQRISTHLDAPNAISAKDFQDRAEAILRKLEADPATATLTKSIRVPFFLPKISDILTRDIGEGLENTYLKAVDKAFVDTYPKYTSTNHHKEGLTGKLSVAPGTRHDRLLDAVSKDVVVGYFFLTLTEYTVAAAMEKIKQLPEQFLLNGGIDTCAAMIGSPSLLMRADGYPPVIWMAALAEANPDAGYHFEAYGYNLTFNRRVHFNQVAESWASAVVVLG